MLIDLDCDCGNNKAEVGPEQQCPEHGVVSTYTCTLCGYVSWACELRR